MLMTLYRFYHVFINNYFYYNVLWGIKFIIFISLDLHMHVCNK